MDGVFTILSPLQHNKETLHQNIPEHKYKISVSTSQITLVDFHSFSSLSYDRSKASSKSSSPHSAI